MPSDVGGFSADWKNVERLWIIPLVECLRSLAIFQLTVRIAQGIDPVDRKKRVVIDDVLSRLKLALDQIGRQQSLDQMIVLRIAGDSFLQQRHLLVEFAGARVEIRKIVERVGALRIQRQPPSAIPERQLPACHLPRTPIQARAARQSQTD